MKHYAIADKTGRWIKSGAFSQAEVRMAAKAGFRVFVLNSTMQNGTVQDGGLEITQGLTGLFHRTDGQPHDFPK